jgi:hypothetical protein
MQLRTRLIVANASLKGLKSQTHVKVGHEIGLFRANAE